METQDKQSDLLNNTNVTTEETSPGEQYDLGTEKFPASQNENNQETLDSEGGPSENDSMKCESSNFNPEKQNSTEDIGCACNQITASSEVVDATVFTQPETDTARVSDIKGDDNSNVSSDKYAQTAKETSEFGHQESVVGQPFIGTTEDVHEATEEYIKPLDDSKTRDSLPTVELDEPSESEKTESREEINLKEHEPLTALLSQIPKKAQKGIFGQNCELILTCIDANKDFIALGSNVGLLFLYDRQEGTVERFKSSSSNEIITCVKLQHGVDHQMAYATSKGIIYMFQLPSNIIGHKKLLQKFEVKDVHKCMVTSVEWSANGMKLFSGDIKGHVFFTNVDFYEGQCQSELLVVENQEIIQLDYAYKILLISTKCRSVICRTDDQRQLVQIGQKERKLLGNFGACFIPGSYKTFDAEIYAARPGLRLWRSNIDGTVKSTFIFKDVLNSPTNKEIDILPLQRNKFKSNTDPQILLLVMFGSDKVVSWNDNSLCIFDPGGNNMYAVQHNFGIIKNVVVYEEEIFVLQTSCDRPVIRIANSPDNTGNKRKFLKHSQNSLASSMSTSQTKDSTFTSSIFGKLKVKSEIETPIKQLISKTAAFIDKNVIAGDSDEVISDNSVTPKAVISDELQRVNEDKINSSENLPPVIHLASPDMMKIEIFENAEDPAPIILTKKSDLKSSELKTEKLTLESSQTSLDTLSDDFADGQRKLRTATNSSDSADSIVSLDKMTEKHREFLPTFRNIDTTDETDIVFATKVNVKKKKKAGKHSTPRGSPNPGSKFPKKPENLDIGTLDIHRNTKDILFDNAVNLERTDHQSKDEMECLESGTKASPQALTSINDKLTENSTPQHDVLTSRGVSKSSVGNNDSVVEAQPHCQNDITDGVVPGEVINTVFTEAPVQTKPDGCESASVGSPSHDESTIDRPKRMNPFNKPEFSQPLETSSMKTVHEMKAENRTLNNSEHVPSTSQVQFSVPTDDSHKKLDRKASFEESCDFYMKYSPQSPSPRSTSQPVDSSHHPLYNRQTSRDSLNSSLQSDTSSTYSPTRPYLIGEERCNIWTEFLAPGNLNSLCLSEKHVWVCDKSDNVHYSTLGGTTLVWRKALGQASQIATSYSGHIVWRLHKNTIYVGTKIIPRRPEGLKWVEAVRDVCCIALDETSAWFIKTNGQVMMQRALTKDRPFSNSYDVDGNHTLKSIVCKNGVVWALTSEFRAVCRLGIKKTCPQGTDWAFVRNEGDQLLFSCITLGVNNIGWGIDVLGCIWYCTDVTKDNPQGEGKWWQVPISDYLIQDITSLEILKNLATKFDPQKLPQLLGVQRGGFISVGNSGVWVCLEQKNILHICKGNIEGYRWNESQPVGIASSTVWKSITAEGADFDHGYVWAQQPNGEIFVFPPETREFRTVPPPCTELFTCMTATKDSVWGLTMSGDVYIRDGMGPHCPEGIRWTRLDLTQLGETHFVHISCGQMNVWALDMEGIVYQRIGIKAPTKEGLNPVWLPVDSNSVGGEFMQVISGPFDWMVWAVDNRRQVYVRVGISDMMPIGTEWVHVPGTPALQLTASAKHVYVVNLNREVLCRFGISDDNPAGDYWKKVPGIVSHITASPSGKLWSINRDGQLWSRDTNYLHQRTTSSPLSSPLERNSSIGSEDGDWELV